MYVTHLPAFSTAATAAMTDIVIALVVVGVYGVSRWRLLLLLLLRVVIMAPPPPLFVLSCVRVNNNLFPFFSFPLLSAPCRPSLSSPLLPSPFVYGFSFPFLFKSLLSFAFFSFQFGVQILGTAIRLPNEPPPPPGVLLREEEEGHCLRHRDVSFELCACVCDKKSK